jgi:hypothetical protein
MVMSYVETRRFSTIFTYVGFLLGVFWAVFDEVFQPIMAIGVPFSFCCHFYVLIFPVDPYSTVTLSSSKSNNTNINMSSLMIKCPFCQRFFQKRGGMQLHLNHSPECSLEEEPI